MIGTVDARPELFPDKTRFILKTESLSREGIFHNVTGAVRVTVREPVGPLRAGERVTCHAKLREVHNFNNPGDFDYRRHMGFQNIWVTASVSRASAVIRMPPGKTGYSARAIASARDAVSMLIDRATAQRPDGVRGVMKALLIGDRTALSQEMRDTFGRTGTAHLLAISGLHIGIVATLAFWGFRFILGRSERVLLAAWATKGAAILSLFPVLSYGVLAGMSPATQRAVIMVAVFLTALLFERERDAMNTLAVAALVILLTSPTALFAISFQLSFTAVFAILYMLGNLSFVIQLKGRPPNLFTRLALFLCVSAAAILGTLPLALYYFNQISLVGMLANCFMVPLIGFAVVPLGLLGVLFLPVSSTVALCLMKVAAPILAWSLSLAASFSEWPFAAARTVTPSLIEIGLYYALFFAVLNYRSTRWGKPVLLCLLVILLADVSYWVRERFCRGDLRMTVLDVGQGSSALLELPGGVCILVDGGGFYDNRFDVGARVVAPFLWQKKIATVDILVLSHPHPDHLNGLVFIADHFNVRETWMTREAVQTRPYHALMDIISDKGIQVKGPEALARPLTIHGVRIETLYPPIDFLERKSQEGWRTGNNNSLVLKVSFKDVSFLLPGDTEVEAERELADAACGHLKSNVLVVPHHGSRTSSTMMFLKCVQPDVGVISSGWKNIFRFPHDQVLDRYQAMGCEIYRTDLQGAVTITTDGKGLDVKTFLPE